MEFRTSVKEDIPTLRELWRLAFGDSEEYMDCFFEGYYSPERVLVLTRSGVVRAMAAWFDMPLVSPSGQQYPAAYLYAVATHPDFRGRGLAGKLLADGAEWLKRQGFDFLTTVPAEPGLHRFFAANGFEEQFSLSVRSCAPVQDKCADLEQVGAAEYGILRETYLTGRTHVRCGLPALSYQEQVCRLSGGGLFRVGSGCACVERAEDTAFVKELLAPTQEHSSILAALAAACPAKTWQVRTPYDGAGESWQFAMLRTLTHTEEAWGENSFFGLAFD